MSPRTANTEAVRERILSAALQAFSVHGYAGATLKQIAGLAGLGSAAHLYYYFPRKEELFAGVLVKYVSIDPMFEDGDWEDPPEVALERYFRRYLSQFNVPERSLAFRLINMEGGRLLTMGLDLSEVSVAHVLDDLVGYFDRQIELGTIRDISPDHAARSMLGILNFQIQSKGTPLLPMVGDDSMVSESLEIVLGGILQRP